MSPLIGLRRTGLPVLFLLVRGVMYSQTVLETAFRLNQADMAILESSEFREDLPCKVTPDKPALRFDLRFHADYIGARLQAGQPVRSQ